MEKKCLYINLESPDMYSKYEWLVGWVFYDMSTVLGYLMPNPFLHR